MKLLLEQLHEVALLPDLLLRVIVSGFARGHRMLQHPVLIGQRRMRLLEILDLRLALGKGVTSLDAVRRLVSKPEAPLTLHDLRRAMAEEP